MMLQNGVVWKKVMSSELPPIQGHAWYDSWDSNNYPLKRCQLCPAIWWHNRVMPPVFCPGYKHV